MNRKSELIRNICKLILKDPVSLPCSHAVCVEHLRDGPVKNGSIQCLKCEKDFDLPRSGSEANMTLAKLILNIESGECLQTLNAHSGWIRGLVFLPNGNLVSCSYDKAIKVWDLDRGECTKNNIRSFTWS